MFPALERRWRGRQRETAKPRDGAAPSSPELERSFDTGMLSVDSRGPVTHSVSRKLGHGLGDDNVHEDGSPHSLTS